MLERLRAQMQAMQMLKKMQDVTANNLANINTQGYKGSKIFYRMVEEQIDGKTVSRTVPGQQVDMSQGVLEPTNNTLDFGIKGKGFFVVESEHGRFLTRNGRMHINADGYLVDPEGARVLGDSGPVYMPEYLKAGGDNGEQAKIEVATDGTIRLNNKVFDRLKIMKVEDVSKLERKGNNYFSASGDYLVEDPSSRVMQGYYEAGNVSSLNEMVDMMQTSKMFETQQRAIKTTDDMLGRMTSRLGQF